MPNIDDASAATKKLMFWEAVRRIVFRMRMLGLFLLLLTLGCALCVAIGYGYVRAAGGDTVPWWLMFALGAMLGGYAIAMAFRGKRDLFFYLIAVWASLPIALHHGANWLKALVDFADSHRFWLIPIGIGLFAVDYVVKGMINTLWSLFNAKHPFEGSGGEI